MVRPHGVAANPLTSQLTTFIPTIPDSLIKPSNCKTRYDLDSYLRSHRLIVRLNTHRTFRSLPITPWRNRHDVPAGRQPQIPNSTMRLPIQAINSFQCSCLEDINKIWSFMDNKTPEELRSSHFIRVLGGLRSTLYLSIDGLELQYHQMRSAWHERNQGDGNANAEVVARLDMIAGSTRVAAARVLRYLDDKMSYQSPQRPEVAFGPSAHLPSHVSTPSDTLCPPGLAACTTTTSPWWRGG